MRGIEMLNPNRKPEGIDGYLAMRPLSRRAASQWSAMRGVRGLELRAERAARSSMIGCAATRTLVDVIVAPARPVATTGELKIETDLDSLRVCNFSLRIAVTSGRTTIPGCCRAAPRKVFVGPEAEGADKGSTGCTTLKNTVSIVACVFLLDIGLGVRSVAVAVA